jgi:hypothetical protein
MKTAGHSRLEQVKSGIMLAGTLIGGFLVLAGLLKGIRLLNEGGGWLAGSALVFSATLILWMTAKSWAKWFCSLCLLLAVRGVFGSLLGASWSRGGIWFWTLIAVGVILFALTLRFLHTTTPNALDRICLAVTIPALFEMLVSQNLLWLALSPGLLLLAFAYYHAAGERRQASNGHAV